MDVARTVRIHALVDELRLDSRRRADRRRRSTCPPGGARLPGRGRATHMRVREQVAHRHTCRSVVVGTRACACRARAGTWGRRPCRARRCPSASVVAMKNMSRASMNSWSRSSMRSRTVTCSIRSARCRVSNRSRRVRLDSCTGLRLDLPISLGDGQARRLVEVDERGAEVEQRRQDEVAEERRHALRGVRLPAEQEEQHRARDEVDDAERAERAERVHVVRSGELPTARERRAHAQPFECGGRNRQAEERQPRERRKEVQTDEHPERARTRAGRMHTQSSARRRRWRHEEHDCPTCSGQQRVPAHRIASGRRGAAHGGLVDERDGQPERQADAQRWPEPDRLGHDLPDRPLGGRQRRRQGTGHGQTVSG